MFWTGTVSFYNSPLWSFFLSVPKDSSSCSKDGFTGSRAFIPSSLLQRIRFTQRIFFYAFYMFLTYVNHSHICALTILGYNVPIPAMHAWLVNGHEFAVFFAAFVPCFEFLFHLRLVVGHQRLATLLDSLDLAGRVSGVDAPLGQIFVTDSGKQFRVRDLSRVSVWSMAPCTGSNQKGKGCFPDDDPAKEIQLAALLQNSIFAEKEA